MSSNKYYYQEKLCMTLFHFNSCQKFWKAAYIVHLWHLKTKYLYKLHIGFLSLIQKGAFIISQLPVSNTRAQQELQINNTRRLQGTKGKQYAWQFQIFNLYTVVFVESTEETPVRLLANDKHAKHNWKILSDSDP